MVDHRFQPDNAVVISEVEVLALKKLVLINHALGQVISDPIASSEQLALTGVLSDVAKRAGHANMMAKMAPPPVKESTS